VSEISEYGEIFGKCDKCYNVIKLWSSKFCIYLSI
jgi:hypothetical protein